MSQSARKSIPVVKKLPPGAPGTRRLAERYGDALVCVRYRVDEATGRRQTTVELVVSERQTEAREFHIRVAADEAVLRQQVKAAGGQWDTSKMLWRVSAEVVRKLKLRSRVVVTS